LLSSTGFFLVLVFKEKAAPILNFAAVVAAVALGYIGFSAATQQALEARRATELSHQPLLVPIHEGGIQLFGSPDKHFPAYRPTRLEEKSTPSLLVQARQIDTVVGGVTHKHWQVILHLKNVGQGAAIILNAKAWNGTGQVGRLSGASSIGSGEVSTFIAQLDQKLIDDQQIITNTILRTQQLWSLPEALERWTSEEPIRLFFLEVMYTDVFNRPGRQRLLRAWFDPIDYGRWHVVSDLSVHIL
jgi:hypothetical protein